MEIRIHGYVPASLLLEQESKQWHALVILDSDKNPTDFVKTHSRSHMYLHFDDVESPRTGKQPPTSRLVEQGLAFAKGKDKLLVSCRAGQSRSAAMAYLIICQEQSAAEAIMLLDPTRHSPNRRVIEIGHALLDELETLKQFSAWRDRFAHIKLSDYIDQLAKEYDDWEAQGARNQIT